MPEYQNRAPLRTSQKTWTTLRPSARMRSNRRRRRSLALPMREDANVRIRHPPRSASGGPNNRWAARPRRRCQASSAQICCWKNSPIRYSPQNAEKLRIDPVVIVLDLFQVVKNRILGRPNRVKSNQVGANHVLCPRPELRASSVRMESWPRRRAGVDRLSDLAQTFWSADNREGE